MRHTPAEAGIDVANVHAAVHRGHKLTDERKPDAGVDRLARELASSHRP
jgi:hypothetical protein